MTEEIWIDGVNILAEEKADYYFEDIIESAIRHDLNDKLFMDKVLYFIRKRYEEEYNE